MESARQLFERLFRVSARVRGGLSVMVRAEGRDLRKVRIQIHWVYIHRVSSAVVRGFS